MKNLNMDSIRSRMLLAALAVSLLTSPRAFADATVQKVQIAEGIFQFITSPDGYVPNGNSVVIVNENDVLVFDTFTRPSTARLVLAEIRKITSKPVRYVVNSHWHPDHWSGNEVYAQEFPGLEIIATEETRNFMLNIANAFLPMDSAEVAADKADFEKEVSTGKLPDGSTLSPERRRKDEEDLRLEQEYIAEVAKTHRMYPTLTYQDQLTLYHGGREFRFISMTGDARGTTVLYLPKEKILITGDLLSEPVPYYTPPLSEHAKSLRALAQFDADTIIPGHGPAYHDKSYLNLELELFESVIAQVNKALREGVVTVEEVRKTVNLEDLRVKFTHDDPELNDQFRRYEKGMVENAYRDARDGKKFEY